jgi:isovaleryl-CoA dehydrogenase
MLVNLEDRVGGQTLAERLTPCRITNAPISSTFIVYARTNREGPPSKGITAFLVERGSKGFEVGEKLDKFGVSVAVRGSGLS